MNDCPRQNPAYRPALYCLPLTPPKKMSQFKSTAGTISNSNSLDLLMKKAIWQQKANHLITQTLQLDDFCGNTQLHIHATYSDPKIIKIYCNTASSCSIIQQISHSLRQHLINHHPQFFPPSIKTIKVIRNQS